MHSQETFIRNATTNIEEQEYKKNSISSSGEHPKLHITSMTRGDPTMT